MLKFIDSAGLGTLFSSPSNGISSWDEGGRTVHPGCFCERMRNRLKTKELSLGECKRVRKSLRCIGIRC
jgi:hypothetical protein